MKLNQKYPKRLLFEEPESSAGYIRDKKAHKIFNNNVWLGFGTKDFFVALIDRDSANKIIIENHYSGKFYAASKLHLGIFKDGLLLGVLQYGCAMNPASFATVVSNTKENEYYELNRMWLCDSLGKNSESRAISYSIKFIKRHNPEIAWIQSFADERCNLLGVVYQAANFDYCGEHEAIFWKLDGVWYHNSIMTRNPDLMPKAKYLQENKERAEKHIFRQFRYIFFIKKKYRNWLNHEIKKYPKE